MIDHYFRRRGVVARLRSGLFGKRLEEFAVYLHDRGHPPNTARAYLWAAEEFVCWIVANKTTASSASVMLSLAIVDRPHCVLTISALLRNWRKLGSDISVARNRSPAAATCGRRRLISFKPNDAW